MMAPLRPSSNNFNISHFLVLTSIVFFSRWDLTGPLYDEWVFIGIWTFWILCYGTALFVCVSATTLAVEGGGTALLLPDWGKCSYSPLEFCWHLRLSAAHYSLLLCRGLACCFPSGSLLIPSLAESRVSTSFLFFILPPLTARCREVTSLLTVGQWWSLNSPLGFLWYHPSSEREKHLVTARWTWKSWLHTRPSPNMSLWGDCGN